MNEPTKSQSSERTTSFSPEQSGVMNDAIRKMVQEAVGASVSAAVTQVFAQLAPVLKDMALTPEKINEMKKPYIDPTWEARKKRETAEWKRQIDASQAEDRARKNACFHKDKNGRTSICLVHNHPDRQPRGVCVICSDWIHPAEWRIASSEEEALRLAGGNQKRVRAEYVGGPRRAYLVDAHKNYDQVLGLESMQ